jgi:hypothetical protein
MRTVLPGYFLTIGGLFLHSASATLIPRLSFEQLTDASETVVAGRITTTWTAWDREHKYIWTHYNLTVDSALKGTPPTIVEFAEPGGALGDASMAIVGAVIYNVGNRVVIFLARMPNGYLRTAGWTQGVYTLDPNGLLHAHGSAGAETVDVKDSISGTSLGALDGMSFAELRHHVGARTRAVGGRAK